MAAHTVIVHDEPAFLHGAAGALRLAGYDVAAFTDPMDALAWLEADRTELLITRVRFGEGKPHGISLGLMAKNRQPGTKVLFMALPEYAGAASDVGTVLISPVCVSDLVHAVDRLLKPPSHDFGTAAGK